MSLSDFFKYDAGLSASVVTCEDAHDLVKYLRLTEKHWHEFQEHADLSWGRSWLFRGQAMESWSVLAPAWRPEGISFLNKTVIGNTAPSANEFDPPVQEHWDALVAKYGESLSVSRLRELLTQAFFERRVIRQFLERADLLGLPVPIMSTSSTDTYDFGVEYISKLISGGTRPIWSEPAVALAQHHGIPTRLIDWTYNPLTAAFFAAEDTVRLQAKGQPISKNMVIYALHEKMATTKHLTLVHHPNSMDTYIRAQEGVFTLDGDAETAYLGTGSWPDYEQSLNRLTSLFGSGLMPRKIIVPVSEARELLRLLSIEGITRDGLMPTLDNVAASIRFEWMLKYTGN